MELGESIDLIDSEVVMFYLYVQFSSASRQPKISNLMFFANPVDRLPSHPSALLRNFPMTRPDTIIK